MKNLGLFIFNIKGGNGRMSNPERIFNGFLGGRYQNGSFVVYV